MDIVNISSVLSLFSNSEYIIYVQCPVGFAQAEFWNCRSTLLETGGSPEVNITLVYLAAIDHCHK